MNNSTMVETAGGYVVNSQRAYDFLKEEREAELAVQAAQAAKVLAESKLPKAVRELRKISEIKLAVLQMVADGFTSKVIASKVFLSASRVDDIRVDLIAKTESQNTPHLVAQAMRYGFIK